MKKVIRYFLRSLVVIFILLTLLITFMLNPQVAYAKKHTYKQFTIYSKYKCSAGYNKVLDDAATLISKSGLY